MFSLNKVDQSLFRIKSVKFFDKILMFVSIIAFLSKKNSRANLIFMYHSALFFKKLIVRIKLAQR